MNKTNDGKWNDLYLALMNVGVVALIATMSIVGMLRLVDRFRPRIGDIVSFGFARKAPFGTDTRITVALPDSTPPGSCVLDAPTMRESGGSLIIEAMRFEPAVSYRVHWAGGRTSDGQANCGPAAELRLSQPDMVAVRLAAGQQ